MAIPAEAEFGIQVNFQPHSEAPTRVFRAMTSLIDAFEQIDRDLAHSISGRIEPTLLLEDIEAGSLRTWLRNTLESIDDDALKSLEWKRIVGSYLVKAKHVAINFLERRSTIDGMGDIIELQKELLSIAEETDVLTIPAYRPIPRARIANAVRLIAESPATLQTGDSAKYVSAEGESKFNLTFNVAPSSLEDILTRETIANEDRMILKVKKPDFLGDSMWEFKFEGRMIPANIIDFDWLSRFRIRSIELMPGDAIKARVRSTVEYGHDGDVIVAHYEVLEVMEIIRTENPTQEKLF